jgi:hypothetical protein
MLPYLSFSAQSTFSIFKKSNDIFGQVFCIWKELEQTMEDVKAYLNSHLETLTISTEGLTNEQQRSVVNQKIVCRCELTKKANFAVARKGATYDRKSVWSGFKERMRCKNRVVSPTRWHYQSQV